MSAFSSTTFSERVSGSQEVHFLVIRMIDSFFLWIGDDAKQLSDLAVAMPSKISSKLLGGQNAELAQSIAAKLATRTGCQVFVSVHVKLAERSDELTLLRRIMKELESNPKAFCSNVSNGHQNEQKPLEAV